MKKFLIGISVSAVMLVTMSTSVLAFVPGPDPNPNGYDAGYAAPGYDAARSNTVCADHGAFAYYTHGGIPLNYDTPRAADGYQTGINNGTLCGQRQGNL